MASTDHVSMSPGRRYLSSAECPLADEGSSELTRRPVADAAHDLAPSSGSHVSSATKTFQARWAWIAKVLVTIVMTLVGSVSALLALFFQSDRWFAEWGLSGRGVATYLTACTVMLVVTVRTRRLWWIFVLALMPVAVPVLIAGVLLVVMLVLSLTQWTFR